MTTVHFHKPNTNFRGAYCIPLHMLDQTLAFLAERGYVVEGR